MSGTRSSHYFYYEVYSAWVVPDKSVHSGTPGGVRTGSEGGAVQVISMTEAETVWLKGTLADRDDSHCGAER